MGYCGTWIIGRPFGRPVRRDNYEIPLTINYDAYRTPMRLIDSMGPMHHMDPMGHGPYGPHGSPHEAHGTLGPYGIHVPRPMNAR